MSLLDAGPDTVLLYPEIATTDADGNPVRVPDETPVTVRGLVQPVSAEESAVTGQDVHTIYRFLCRAFPAGAFARIEWDGRSWDVDGEPMRHHSSEATSHVKVLLVARTPEVH